MRPVPLRALVALLPILCLPAAEAAAARTPETVPGQYVVVYERSVADPAAETNERERRHGFHSRLRYSRAIKGFAARLSPAQVERLKADPEVAIVAPDRRVRASATLAAGETVPTGVRRMQAASGGAIRGASTANVAVIDTGIDLDHPDLVVSGGRNCVTPAAAPDDDNGHGTHVAGTIAARNTGAGVVGVAPGTRLFAAKVLDAGGGGTASQVICGIDWVTSTRTDADPANDVAVANMSLGGPGAPVGTCASTTDPEHRAICASIAAGVTYVVAAGNDGWDFDYAPNPDTPAAFPEVLTVTAASDSDGSTGGTGGAPTCRTGEADERYASFSNFAATAAGQAHTTAAPGVCIRSTWPGGGHNTISGTSMASPHVAAAVALCLGEAGVAGPCAGLAPAQIVAKMRSDAAAVNNANTWFGFTGDPLRPVSGRYHGHLQYAGAGAPVRTAPTYVTVGAAPSRATIQSGSLAGGTVSALAADDTAFYRVNSTSSYTKQTAWYGTFTGVPSTLRDLKVTYKGSNSRTCTQVVEVYRFTDARWVAIDQRSVGTTQVLLSGIAVGGTLSSHVNSAGDLHVRVRCSTTSGTFAASGNLLRIAYSRPA
ncbi:MAG TPA: S8 family serine peptidase [Solirubrobacteraceae bacterium]|nr:S8 family serine peptidase [Solirubrobacteraceae bacterium]